MKRTQRVEDCSATLFNPSVKRKQCLFFQKRHKKGVAKRPPLNKHPSAYALETAVEQEVNIIQLGLGISRLAKHLRHRPMIVIDMGIT